MTKTSLFPIKLGLVTFAILALPRAGSASNAGDVVKAFQDNGGYVKPFATLFGSMTNSGWYQSSAVPSGFGFYLGIPMSITKIADDDRSFSYTYVDDGCQQYHANNPSGKQVCREKTEYQTPTIFGRKRAPLASRSIYNGNSDSIVDHQEIPLSDGKSEVSDFNWIPFLEPQISVSYKYTELKLRYFGFSVGGYSLSMPAFGIQHDLASVLPPLPVPVNFSIAADMTFFNASWKPGDNVKGTMDLSGQSYFVGVLAGYTYARWLEVFLETGWEGASLKSGGDLVIHDTGANPDPDESVKPRLTLEGRNGFRASLSLAFHIGYDAVLSQNVGANLSNQVGILAYRYKK
jgi:hypothetical protein